MSDRKTANFNQKGFTKNFLDLMSLREKFEKCCLEWLTQVYTTDSDTVTFSGLGTQASPLTATAIGGTNFELETVGTTGPATFISGVLNIPNYSAASGGTAVPGGSDMSIQYNKTGGFAGDSHLIWDYTTNVLTISDGTLLLGGSEDTDVVAIFGSSLISNAVIDFSGTDGNFQLGFDTNNNFYLFDNVNSTRLVQMNSVGQFLTVYGPATIQNTLFLNSGLSEDTYLTIDPNITNSGAVLNFNGILMNPTIIATGGTSIITGYNFSPTITGTPASLTAFKNTVGNNIFNTNGGLTIIGPQAPVGTSIFQVTGNSLFVGKIGIGITASSPTASIDSSVPGTTAPGDGQLKLCIDDGLKATPENGLFEYDGTHLYFTLGGTRHTIV